MENKTFVCTCCKKKFIIPVFRWAPDRGADFFSCDWNEKDMLKHKLCGKCSDSVRLHLTNLEIDNYQIIKINFCHDIHKKWSGCKFGKAITAIDEQGHLCFLKECGNIEGCQYQNTLNHIPKTPVYRSYPFSGEFMTMGEFTTDFTDKLGINCPKCKGVIVFPENKVSIKCKGCKTTYYRDVYEEIKKLQRIVSIFQKECMSNSPYDHSQRFTYDEPKIQCSYCRHWKWKMETKRGMLGACHNKKIKMLIDCEWDTGAILTVVNTISNFGCKLGERRTELKRPYPDEYYLKPWDDDFEEKYKKRQEEKEKLPD